LGRLFPHLFINFRRISSFTAIYLGLLSCSVIECRALNPLGTFYPEYCSEHIESHRISSLQETVKENFSLIQVQVIVRHGGRTTWTTLPCWDDYEANWDCDALNFMDVLMSEIDDLKVSLQQFHEVASITEQQDLALYFLDTFANAEHTRSKIFKKLRLRISTIKRCQLQPMPVLEVEGGKVPGMTFRKVYDAGENYLGGSCQVGGLLDQGYHQEMENGRHLRNAYLGPEGLFDTYDLADVPAGKTYFQSDDEQRTLMSGQVLVDSMFNATNNLIVDWHTMDFKADQMMAPKEEECPVLSTYRDDALQSDKYQQYNSSTEVVQLQAEVEKVFGSTADLQGSLHDCVLANLCADKDLPEGVTQELIERIIDYRERTEAAVFSHQDSIYSKTGIQQLIKRMKERIKQAIEQEDYLALAIYSGHDTTIMPLLAALGLWDEKWAPYASMVTLELYQENSSPENFYTRIIYNGKELRHKDCADQDALCPLSVLLTSMAFADDPLSCLGEEAEIAEANASFIKGVDSKVWIGVSLLCLVLGTAVGVVVSAVFGWSKRRNNTAYHNLDERKEEKGNDVSTSNRIAVVVHDDGDDENKNCENSSHDNNNNYHSDSEEVHSNSLWGTAVVEIIEEETSNVL